MSRSGWSSRVDATDHREGLFKRGRRSATAALFEDGSAFEHDAAYLHPFLGVADIHRLFPGIGRDPEEAFDRMWRERENMLIANYRCWVPSVPAQRLVLLLHAARGGGIGHPDVRRAWINATTSHREQVDQLARELDAQVALAAATGRLESFRGARGHDFWQLLAAGDYSLATLWWARVRAAPSVWSGLRVGVRLMIPTPGRLVVRRGHPLVGRELASAYIEQGRRGISAVAAALGRRRPHP